MINLRNSPFLWCALLLLTAFGSLRYLDIHTNPFLAPVLTGVFLLASIGTIFQFGPRKSGLATFLLSICLISAGCLRYLTFYKSIFPAAEQYEAGKITASIQVHQVLKSRQDAITLSCSLRSLTYAVRDEQTPVLDKYVLVRIKEEKPPTLVPGTRLTIEGYLQPLAGPMNPHAFDLKSYYKTLGIRHQLSCRDSRYVIHAASSFSLLRLTARWQNALCNIITKNTSSGVAQMTNALVFGHRSAMDEDIRNAFANAGAMHVLSVSGMHMAIIYSMLYVLLGAPGQGRFSRRLIRFILYAIAIMVYIGLTGASPAVSRAGLMIMLYLLGKSMGWNTRIWNLLGFAAFLMLWLNPFIWQQIGFQLSFLAMAGILLFAQPIIRSCAFRHTVVHRLWEVTAVSVAAQVFILPVILHQFYQLPLTFILSSLVAMPAGYIIIFGAFVNITLSPFQLDGLWQVYDKAGQLFLDVMEWLAHLNPDMNFSLPLLPEILLMLATVLYAMGLIYTWRAGRKIAVCCALSALLTLGWHRAHQWTTSELIIYHSYSGLIIDLFENGHCISIRDSTLSERQMTYTTRGHRVHRDVIHAYTIRSDQPYARASFHFSQDGFYSSSLMLSIWNGDKQPVEKNAFVHYVVVNQCPDLTAFEKYLKNQRNSFTILPAHLPWQIRNRIRRILTSGNFPFRDIAESGYYAIAL